MKYVLSIILLSAFSFWGAAQDMTKFKLYDPVANAEKEIAAAVQKAAAEGKNVFVQVGGNWCIWCARFSDFVTGDLAIDSLIQSNYVVYHLNYSKENKNGSLLEKYRFPQRFGFPVFLVLNKKGELIHTQNSEYLEDGAKSYNKSKVVEFLKNWTPAALDPGQYKEQ
jgi:thioredoxin-related protein